MGMFLSDSASTNTHHTQASAFCTTQTRVLRDEKAQMLNSSCHMTSLSLRSPLLLMSSVNPLPTRLLLPTAEHLEGSPPPRPVAAMGDDSEWMKLPVDQKCEHKVAAGLCVSVFALSLQEGPHGSTRRARSVTASSLPGLLGLDPCWCSRPLLCSK